MTNIEKLYVCREPEKYLKICDFQIINLHKSIILDIRIQIMRVSFLHNDIQAISHSLQYPLVSVKYNFLQNLTSS